MKQEQRLVAEVYRFLAPFVDTTKSIYVSLDGQAALTGMEKGMFTHPTIPDLWFTFVGAEVPTLIEVKTVRDDKVLLMQSQLQAWCSMGNGTHRPQSWIAVNTEFNCFYYWTHEAFLPRLDRPTNRRPGSKIPKTIYRELPDELQQFRNANELALHIIRQTAITEG
jgi:hypothetical protein